MTEETNPTAQDDVAGDEASGQLNDKRFEVKWQKKGSSEPARQPSEEDRPEADVGPTDTDLRRQLDEAREQINNLRDRWQRAAADLANLKRRTEEERGDAEKFASMLIVAELLPVLDNFERAIATIPGDLMMLTWVQGVALIERHLRAILERQGLSEIEAQGKSFNAALHEAIAEKATDEAPAGSVLQVYQKGYELNGRLIRPSLVEVARPTSQDTLEGQEPGNCRRRGRNRTGCTNRERGHLKGYDTDKTCDRLALANSNF